MSPLAAQLIWLCRVEVGSEGEEWFQQTFSPATNILHPKWWLFPNTGDRNQHQPVTPNLGESISAGRERAGGGRILSHPAPHQLPKPASQDGIHPISHLMSPPGPSRLSLTESSQPQEQNPQQAGLRRHGQGNHGLPWSRRSQGLRFGDAPTDRCSGCPAAGADAGTGPLIPRTALARVCVCVPVAGWGPPGDCGAGHSRGRRGRRPPGRGSRVTRRRGAILALRRPDPAASTRSGRRVGSGESWGPRSQRRSRAEERVLTSQSMPYPSPSATWARKEGQEGA